MFSSSSEASLNATHAPSASPALMPATSAAALPSANTNAGSLCVFSKTAKKFTPAHISFEREKENTLSIVIETERFRLQSCTLEDKENYRLVFGNSKVMEKNASGEIDTAEELNDRIQYYVYGWEHNNPLNTSLAVFDNETDDFVGQVALYTNKPKTISFFYLFRPEYWNTKYIKTTEGSASASSKTWAYVGTETVSAVVLDYVPQLKAKGYQVFCPQFTSCSVSSNATEKPAALSDAYTPLETLQTTARLDNPGSIKVLEAVGMKKIEEKFMFGNGMRGVFRKSV